MLAALSFLLLAPLLTCGDNPHSDVFARLQDPSHVVRLHAATELGDKRVKDEKSILALAAALADPHEMVRFYAADALGKIGKDAEIVSADLSRALGDESWIVQRKVAIALGKVRAKEGVYLTRLHEVHPEEQLRPHVQLLLLYYKQDPPPSMKAYTPDDLADTRWDVRLRALRYFWEQHEREHAATILAMLKDDSNAVRGMAFHLFESGDRDAQRALFFQQTYLRGNDYRTAGYVSSIKSDDIYSLVAAKRLYGHNDARVQRSLLALIERQEWEDEATIDFIKRMTSSGNVYVSGHAARLLDKLMVSSD